MTNEPNQNRYILRERSPLRAAVALELVRAGITQRELAAKLGVPPTTLSTWVTGAHPAPEDLTRRIEHALGLVPEALSQVTR